MKISGEMKITKGAKKQSGRFLLAHLSAIVTTLLLSTSTFAVGLNQQVSSVCKNSTDAAFRAKYCMAAKDLKKGHTANLATSAIWGGVTTVCALACGKVGVGGLTCKLSSYGGSAGEGVLANKFIDALKGEGMKVGGDLASGTLKQGAEEAAGKVNAEACTTAGTSALKSYEKISNAQQNVKSITQLREQTKGMNTQSNTTTNLFQGATTEAETSVAADVLKGDVCSDSAASTARGAIKCATTMDPTLPGFVKTEEFLKDIEKATGKTADAFFAGFDSPAKALMEAPGISKLGSEQQSAALDALGNIEKYSEMKVAGKFQNGGSSAESYRSAGGSPNIPASDDGLDVNGMLAGALSHLKGGGDEKESANGVDHLSLGGKRGPASVISPEDRTISIFDRVEWRYHAVTLRDHLESEKGVGK